MLTYLFVGLIFLVGLAVVVSFKGAVEPHSEIHDRREW